MKIITSLIAVSLVASAITYVAMSGKKAIDADRNTVAKKEQVTDEIAKLHRENQKLKVKASRVEIVEKEVVVLASSADSPEVIVDYLSKLEFKSQERGAGNTDAHRILVRQVIRQFEELTSMGSKALPSIADFLSRDVDLEFRENTEEITTGNWTRGQMYLDPIFPPCLRIGLLNTVRHIGKRNGESLSEAERILLGVLSTTGRAIEVVYIERALEDMSKDIHKDAFLLAAQDLLMEPIQEDEREVSYLDRQNRGTLFDLLRRHKDTTFVEQAKTQLLRNRKRKEKKDGKEIEVTVTEVDRSVLGYLTGVLGAKATPILSHMYENPALDYANRGTLAGAVASYVGISEDANILVTRRMNEGFQLLATQGDQQKQNRERAMRTLTHYLGNMGGGKNIPTETIRLRQQFLSSLRSQTNDKEIQTMMNNVDRRLKDMSDPEKAKKMDGRFDPRRSPDQNRDRR